jgi:PAS domain S-box-containing protein
VPATPPSIVLVDDADDVRMLVRSALRLSGRFDVVGEGGNGAEAIELAKVHHPEVLLLDVSMPVMDGLEALPLIVGVSPATRVVMYTGFDERGLADRARELGATGFLQKSIAIDRLAADLEEVLVASGAPVAQEAPPIEAMTLPDDIAAIDVEVLDEHLERFREVFEEAAIGMATMTLTGRLVRANKALARLVGRSVAELVGVPYVNLAQDLSNEAMDKALAAHTQGTDVVRLEHNVLVAGATRRLSATIATARDSQERPLYLFLQAQDVTAQRAAEEALRTSEERFGVLVDAVADYAIFMLDPQGRVMSWNSGAQRAKGYTADEIIGQHFRIFYPAEKQLAQHPEHELAIAETEGRYEEEGWRIRKDGSTFWANVVISAVHNSAGALIGFAKVTRDVSERRKLLDQGESARLALAEANRQLEEANERLARAAAEQSEFVSVTIHELRNPISVLTGAGSMLLQHWADLTAEERTGLFDSMTSSSARLNRLLTDLLTSSRLESRAMDLHVQAVDVATLLGQVVKSAASSIPDADLAIDCESGLVVDADPDRLAQAIENLVLNGLRHGAGQVRVSGARRGRQVEVRVSDSGPGVAPTVLPRLFERFATGRQPGGTGLGLFIVRELARAHGGDVRYEPGAHPTFVLSIPAIAVVPG